MADAWGHEAVQLHPDQDAEADDGERHEDTDPRGAGAGGSYTGSLLIGLLDVQL